MKAGTPITYGHRSLRRLLGELLVKLKAAVEQHGAAAVGKACDAHPDAIGFALARRPLYAGTVKAIRAGLEQLAQVEAQPRV